MERYDELITRVYDKLDGKIIETNNLTKGK